MRTLACRSALVSVLSVLSGLACSGDSGDSNGTVTEEKALIASDTDDSSITIGKGMDKVTVTMKAGSQPAGTMTKVQAVSGVKKTGPSPVTKTSVQILPRESKFAMPVAISWAGLAPPVGKTRKQVTTSAEEKNWKVGPAAMPVPAADGNPLPDWQTQVTEGGIVGLADEVDSGPLRPFVGSNASGRIDGGPVIGTGVTPLASLRKPVTIKDLGPAGRFTYGPAYAMRYDTMTPGAWFAFSIKNNGAADCFIQLGGVTFKDAAGAMLGEQSFGLVGGSVGSLTVPGSPPVFTNTCLGAGETGWVTMIVNDTPAVTYYQSAASIEFTSLTGMFALGEPLAKMKPVSYDWVAGTGTMTVTFKNVGSATAVVDSSAFTLAILLDPAGDPLMWGFAGENPMPADGVIPVDASGTSEGTFPFSDYEGTGSNLFVMVDFDDKGSMMVRARSTDPVADAVLRQDLRNQAEMRKLARILESASALRD